MRSEFHKIEQPELLQIREKMLYLYPLVSTTFSDY